MLMRRMQPMHTREPNTRDRLRAGAMIVAVVATLVAIAFLVRERPMYAILLMLVPLALLIAWHARTTAYRCEHCGTEFTISAWRDALSPHTLEAKYLRCPACGRRSWARALVRV